MAANIALKKVVYPSNSNTRPQFQEIACGKCGAVISIHGGRKLLIVEYFKLLPGDNVIGPVNLKRVYCYRKLE